MLPGVMSPAVIDPASIAVDRPAAVPATYAKQVSGHVNVTPAVGRWIVQAYKDTATGRVQVPLQAAVAGDGTFMIDLGAASNPPKGSWALGLLDSANSYAPYGTGWPAALVFDGWTVSLAVVTDVEYPVAQQPARADGTFIFASSAQGTKVFRLVDARSGSVLAESSPDFGLVRSSSGSTTSAAYDQAMATTTAVALGQDATALTAGLIALQRAGGGFVDVVDVRNPGGREGMQWTGNTALATWALLRLQTLSSSDPSFATTRQAAVRGLTFLKAQRRTDGLLDAGQSGDGSDSPTWVGLDRAQPGRLAGPPTRCVGAR